jgi:hypothetical protein
LVQPRMFGAEARRIVRSEMTITLHRTQVISWPDAPGGIAQIDELRRTRVRIVYPRNGKLCRPIVKASAIADAMLNPTLPIRNPLERAEVKHEKTYKI